MVYRGGLENRFGLTPDGGSNPSLSASPEGFRGCRQIPQCGRRRAGCNGVTVPGGGPASQKEQRFVSNWTTIIIWVAVIGAVFGYLWWQGQIRALANYVQETREELKKCSWPSWTELKGSTVVIMISIALLGAFTEAVDRILYVILFVF